MSAKLNANALETKYAAMAVTEVKVEDGGEGVFEGYASLFGEVDTARDVVAPGAFAASLAARRSGQVRMLFQHDPKEVVGVWLDIAEDNKGLAVRGRLLTELRRGAELYALLQAGALDGLSIGFRAAESHTDPKTGIRRLARVDLYEISLVTFPMLGTARIGAFKGGTPTTREFERLLTREAGLTRSQARAVTRHGLKALDPAQNSERDARSRNATAALAARIRQAATRLRPENGR